jgi:hypothetical protein
MKIGETAAPAGRPPLAAGWTSYCRLAAMLAATETQDKDSKGAGPRPLKRGASLRCDSGSGA